MNYKEIERFLATESESPAYCVEPAKSSRSTCQQCSSLILKDDIRIGMIQTESSWGTGKYNRWCHLKCWRVPARVSLALPSPQTCDDARLFEHALLTMNNTLLAGTIDLSLEARAALVLHVMVPDNWASRSESTVAMKENIKPLNSSSCSLSAPYNGTDYGANCIHFAATSNPLLLATAVYGTTSNRGVLQPLDSNMMVVRRANVSDLPVPKKKGPPNTIETPDQI